MLPLYRWANHDAHGDSDVVYDDDGNVILIMCYC